MRHFASEIEPVPAEPALTGTVFYGRCREFDSAKYPQHMLQGLVAAWNTRYVYVRSKEKSALAGVIRQVSQLTGQTVKNLNHGHDCYAQRRAVQQ